MLYNWTIIRPDNEQLDLTGRKIDFTALDDGDHAVQLVVTDQDGGRAEQTVLISVANGDPILQSVELPSVGYVGFSLQLAATAEDVPADLDDLNYHWDIFDPDGQPVTRSGSTVDYSPAVPGTHRLTLTVSDGNGGQATATGEFEVYASTVSLTTFEVDAGVGEGAETTFRASAEDAFGAEVVTTWTVTDQDGEVTDLDGPIARFIPPDDGIYQVSLSASSINGETTASTTLPVQNLPPKLQTLSVPNRATATLPFVLSATATDPAGANDPLIYTWTLTRPDGSQTELRGEEVVYTATATGFHGIRLLVSDQEGGQVVVEKVVAVLNTPPSADTGGPYVVDEGSTIRLDGLTRSTDIEDGAAGLRYEWDLDGDGVFGETGTAATLGDEVGHSPHFSAAKLDGPSEVEVTLRVFDSEGVSDVDTTTIRVDNVAPSFDSVESSNPDVVRRSPNGAVSIGGSFSDPAEELDTHFVLVDWGDTSPEVEITVNQSLDTFAGNHLYANGGIYTITITLIDDIGDRAVQTTTAVVQGVGLVDSTLYIIGTDGRDHANVKFKEKKDELKVDVKLNQGERTDEPSSRIKQSFELSAVERVVAYLSGGDDHYHGHSGGDDSAGISQFIFGGAGDDHLKGGAGNDVLSGGSGDDDIDGGRGADLLIGGTGKDKLKGGYGDDLLIADTVSREDDFDSVDAALADWTSGDLASALLHLGDWTDDGDKDDLKGEKGDDYLVFGEGDKWKQ